MALSDRSKRARTRVLRLSLPLVLELFSKVEGGLNISRVRCKQCVKRDQREDVMLISALLSFIFAFLLLAIMKLFLPFNALAKTTTSPTQWPKQQHVNDNHQRQVVQRSMQHLVKMGTQHTHQHGTGGDHCDANGSGVGQHEKDQRTPTNNDKVMTDPKSDSA